MRCEEIMKRDVHCTSPNQSAEVAARRMRDQNVGFLPVCDDSGRVVGAVTDRDLTTRVMAEGRPGQTPVEIVMSREVIACRKEDDVQHAEELMARHRKSRIMCIDEDERLVGVISLSDIAQHERGSRASDTLRQVSAREVRA